MLVVNVGPDVELDLAGLPAAAEGAVVVVNPAGEIGGATERAVGTFVAEVTGEVFVALQQALQDTALVTLAVLWSELVGTPGRMLLEASRGIVQSLQLESGAKGVRANVVVFRDDQVTDLVRTLGFVHGPDGGFVAGATIDLGGVA